MPVRPPSTPPAQPLADTPAPKKTRFSETPPNHLPASHTATPSKRPQLTIDDDDGTNSIMSQCGEAEDEYTLSAYGDISLSEVQVPPLPEPAHSSSRPMQPRAPQPRLRLRVRRPPMPKHRMSFTYVPDPLPHSGGIEPDERWPGSPRPATKSPHRLQPLVSPVSPLSLDAVGPPSFSKETQPAKKNGLSLEKFFEGFLPSSPSIRLSPPGSPENRARGLPKETHERRSSLRHARNPSGREDAAKPPQVSPAPTPRQEQPKSTPWRTRLPPRLPIPKWDIHINRK